MSDPTKLACLVVDEHPVVRRGVRALLEQGFHEVELLDAPSAERIARIRSSAGESLRT